MSKLITALTDHFTEILIGIIEFCLKHMFQDVNDGMKLVIVISRKTQDDNLKSQIATSSLGGKRKLHVGVNVFTYTFPSSRITTQDISNFNAQYPTLTVKKTAAFHDRFLIIDSVEGYHIGASLKDAGKKCFGITKIEGTDDIKEIIKKAQLSGT